MVLAGAQFHQTRGLDPVFRLCRGRQRGVSKHHVSKYTAPLQPLRLEAA